MSLSRYIPAFRYAPAETLDRTLKRLLLNESFLSLRSDCYWEVQCNEAWE